MGSSFLRTNLQTLDEIDLQRPLFIDGGWRAPLGDSGVERRGEEAHHDVRLLDEGIESPTVLRIVRPIEKLMAKNKQQQQQQQQKEVCWLERQDNIIRPRLDIRHSTLDTRL